MALHKLKSQSEGSARTANAPREESEKREEGSRSSETLADMARTDDISKDFGNSVFSELLKGDAL